MNVSIIYVPNLHAKYYANEVKGIVTSINLYDYSFKNNIEFAIFSEVSLINFTKSADQLAWQTSWEIAETHEAVFIKRPVYEKKLLSALMGKNYIKSDILHDTTGKFYSQFGDKKSQIKKLTDFPNEVTLGSTSSDRPSRDEIEVQTHGFCIRTGAKIPFNLKRPYSEQAYKSWLVYKNHDYPEKYCHKTGKESKGKTTMKNPVL